MTTRFVCTTTVVVWFALGGSANRAVAETSLFVSPRGDDAWSGYLAAPADGGSWLNTTPAPSQNQHNSSFISTWPFNTYDLSTPDPQQIGHVR